MFDLHDFKSIGHHNMRKAREDGTSSAVPMIFVGVVTVMIGATMAAKGFSQLGQNRGR